MFLTPIYQAYLSRPGLFMRWTRRGWFNWLSRPSYSDAEWAEYCSQNSRWSQEEWLNWFRDEGRFSAMAWVRWYFDEE